MLAATIPVSSGRITAKASDEIIETLTLTVPRFAAPEDDSDVIDWRPGATDDPLARFGQTLDVSIITGSVVTGQVWETRVGRYQISNWEQSGDVITVSAESNLARPRDDKLVALTSPSGTFKSEARRILPSGMGVSFDPALVDRACPSGMSWSTDRLKNLRELADTWPALLRIDQWGQVVFRAPLSAVPVPVLTLRDGEGGTLIEAPRSDTRKDAFNEVTASTSSTADADVQGVAQITAGPMSVNGNYGKVSKQFTSGLLATTAQANAAAATVLANSVRPAQAVPVRIAPDPRIALDDPVEILRGEDDPLWGWVTAYELPLTTKDGDMRIDVGLPT